MAMYNENLSLAPDNLLNDHGNLCLLRPDLHYAFDDRKWVFYPKGENCFVVHMLEPSPDLVQLYHNVMVQTPFRCHPNFLNARLAWAILPSCAVFWSKRGVKCAVLQHRVTENGICLVEEEVTITPEFQAAIGPSRSRSSSPRKRARPSENNQLPISKRSRLTSSGDTSPEGQVSDGQDHSSLHQVMAAFAQRYDSMSPDAQALCPTYHSSFSRVETLKQEWLAKQRNGNENPSVPIPA